MLIRPPKEFDGYRLEHCRVSSTCLVYFDRNRDSVPCEAVGKVVQVKVYAGRLKVVEGGRLIAEHKQGFGRDKTVYDPWHYVHLLDRTPGALGYGAPFTAWALPEAIERVCEVLRRYDDWDRQFAGILTAVPSHGLDVVAEACQMARSQRTVGKDAVLSILNRQQDDEPAPVVSIPSRLEYGCMPVADCACYDRLLRGAHAAQ